MDALPWSPGKAGCLTIETGGEVQPQVPMPWQDGIPQSIVAGHAYAEPSPDLAIFALPNATIAGAGWTIFEGKPIWAREIYPEYLREYAVNGWVRLPVVNDDSEKAISLSQCWNVWHFNCLTYGHWLLEALPKVFLVASFLRKHPQFSSVPIVLPKPVFPSMMEAVAAISPSSPIIQYIPDEERVVAATTYLPAVSRNYFYNASVIRSMTGFSKLFPRTESKILLGRRVASKVRYLENFDEIRQIAEARRYETFFPEDHSFIDQVRVFAGARCIVGEFGSALHNSIFARPGTPVLALNWVNEVQSRIARLKGLPTGYLLPEHGLPVLYDRQETAARRYRISESAFARRLDDIERLID